ASLDARAGKVPSLAPFHPPASRLERSASDLFGIEFTGLPDPRPWLDHGRWPVQHPLAESPRPGAALPPHRFLEAEGPSLHPSALWLRAVMAELERIANHLGDVGAVCNDAAFSMMHAECGILREQTLRACATAFGHRLMMDCVVPGGVAVDLEPAGVAAILSLTASLRGQFPELVALHDTTASLPD